MRLAKYIKQYPKINRPSRIIFTIWSTLVVGQLYPVRENSLSGAILNGGVEVCAVNSINGKKYFQIIEIDSDNMKGI